MIDVKDCPKGPHSKEEWKDGSEFDFCYECGHWHYLFPTRKANKPKPKKRVAKKKAT